MSDNSRKTEIMGYDSSATMVMPSDTEATMIMPRTAEDLISQNKSAEHEKIVLSSDNIDGYKVKSVISENTGEAALYLVERDNENYVLKLFHKNKRPKDDIIQKLQSIKCENVISIIDSGNFGDKFYMILPYFEKGDISKSAPVSEEVLEKIIIPSVNNGLNALHEKGIIHRDVKPTNIFMSNDGTYAVIGDFGISSVISQGMSVRATSMSRTLGYAAPETSAGFISKECDYYSFGITLLHLASGVDPFADMTEIQIMYYTLNKRLEIPSTISSRLTNLIIGLTAKDREQRLGYEDVLKWLEHKELKVNDLTEKYIPADFDFMGESYNDLPALARALADNWEEAEKYLYRGIAEKALQKEDEGLFYECQKLRNIRNKDIAVFKLIYLLDPHAPIYYKGKKYITVDDLAENMEEYHEPINEMLLNGLLSYYLEINGYSAEFIRQVEQLAEKIRSGHKEYYFAVKYLLDDDFDFYYKDKIFTGLDDCIDYFKSLTSYSDMEDAATDLIYSDKFKMWMYSLGYDKEVIEWQDAYDNAKWED